MKGEHHVLRNTFCTDNFVLYVERKIIMKLTKQDRLNLIDALLEWDDEIGPKELDDDEVGLNFERYSDLMQRLIDSIRK